MDITLEHPFFLVKKQLATICKPLFSYTPYHYFDYQRFYYDGQYLALPIHYDFAYQIFKTDLLPNLEELQINTAHYVFLSPTLLLPDLVLHPQKFINNIKLSEQCNVYHRMYINFNFPEYMEVFGFGLTKPTKNIIDHYMNHRSLLEKFCIYFRESAKNIVCAMKKNKIYFDYPKDPGYFKDLNFKADLSYTEFLKEIKLKNYHIQGNNIDCQLSEREFQCLLWSAKNKTAKEIGRILSLSPRTVEAYLVTLKNKMNCESKLQLIEKALQNQIIRSLIDE